MAFALQADGWYLRRDVIWNKPNPMPESALDRPTNAHEYLFLLSRSERYHYDAEAVREPHARDWSGGRSGGTLAGRGKRPDHPPQPGDPNHRTGGGQWERTEAPEPNPAGRNLRDVWTIPTQSYPGAHFATFPEDLVTRPILAGTSERGACGECGAPWERRVEKPKRKSWHSHGDDAGRLVHARQGGRADPEPADAGRGAAGSGDRVPAPPQHRDAAHDRRRAPRWCARDRGPAWADPVRVAPVKRPGNDGARSPAMSRELAAWLVAEVRLERALADGRMPDGLVVIHIGLARMALIRTVEGRQN